MLAACPGVAFLWEPFHRAHDPGRCAACFGHTFPYVTDRTGHKYEAQIRAMLAFRYALGAKLRSARSLRALASAGRGICLFWLHRMRGARPLLKDPRALFSAEWLAARFDTHVVVVIRHPAAFACSLRARGWTHPFDDFLRQPDLMTDHLAAYEREIRRFAENEQDILDQAALLWKLAHHMVSGYQARHPDWHFVRHEDLSREPVAGLRALAEAVGLPFDTRAERVVRWHSAPSDAQRIGWCDRCREVRRDSAANIGSWQSRLSPAEIQRVRARVGEIGEVFYAANDWR